jgi:hypothetical protein
MAPWPTQGVEQQLRAVVAHEDAYHFEAQLDELSKGRQKHADMLADMAEGCAASLSEVRVLSDGTSVWGIYTTPQHT